LIAVLAAVVVLSLAAYQYGELMVAEYRAADSAIRAAQSRALAVSGVHFAAAALADQNTVVSTFGGNLYDNASAFRGVEVHADDRPRFAGRFSLVAPPLVDDAINGNTQQRFGVVDEAGKINLNALVALDSTGKVAHDVLIKLPNMTEEIVDAIIDWIDADDEPQPNGAENLYYGGLIPSYRCKNGPLDSLEELLLVRGVTKELLFGNDRNRNGLSDSDEDDAAFDPGWSAYLTVYSRELNRDLEAQPRIYLNDRDLNGLYDKLTAAVGDELATWIVAYRLYSGSSGGGSGGGTPGGQLNRNMLDFNRRASSISSIFSLIDGTVSIPQSGNAGGGSGGGGGGGVVTSVSVTASGGMVVMAQSSSQSGGSRGGGQSGGGGNNSGGGQSGGGGSTNLTFPSPLADASKLRQYLPILLDKCTTRNDAEIPARINIRTAPRAVLACLPGLDEADVQAIIDARPAPDSVDPTDLTYQTAAWLKTEANLSNSKIRALERYITGRSQTYRVQSLGYFDQGGPVARVEAVIDTNAGQPRIVYFRDLTELGRGGEVPR
jgi:DNA uptake protein ComE-like DNA-binding protein